MTLEIDEVDFGFITSIYREDAKMAKQARQMMYEAKKGETK